MVKRVISHPKCDLGKPGEIKDFTEEQLKSGRILSLTSTEEEYFGKTALESLKGGSVDLEQVESDAVKALRDVYELVVGKKAGGRASVETLKGDILESLTKSE